jgi:hypothetical protein
MSTEKIISELEARLNSFQRSDRLEALEELASLAQSGSVGLEPEKPVANMHCHTFFSFNAFGYSPAGLAWLGKKRGFKLMGTVDFDVLDAVDEFHQACDLVGLRGSCGMETRVFVPEFATREINSPGEPGVYYHMGIGFISGTVPTSAQAILNDLSARAARRNRDMTVRLNEFLAPVCVDYERDVLPLTPAGNATERHMLVAYAKAAEAAPQGPDAFWAQKLGLPQEQIVSLRANPASFQNTVRSKLMKRGGVGYVQPGPSTFPTVEEFHSLIVACEALPCATWLDGISTGEQAMQELLEMLISKGVVALNIVPDRNWNIKDPEVKKTKVANLYQVVELAGKLNLPLNIGTEMNAPGLKLVDDFDAPELAPVQDAFLDGAYFIYGHTMLQRAAHLGYQSAWAKQHLPGRAERNAFYTRLGKLTPPGMSGFKKLNGFNNSSSPDQILAAL